MDYSKNLSLINIQEFVPSIGLVIEEWRPVVGNKHYMISSFGRVKSLKHYDPIIISQIETHNGYRRVALYTGSKSKTFPVHRLVAESFIPNPHKKKFVNHLKGIKYDNRACEIEWCTLSENEQHSIRVLGKKPSYAPAGIGHHCNKKIIARKDDKFTPFDSIRIAATELNINVMYVSSVLHGRHKSAKGYQFLWADPNQKHLIKSSPQKGKRGALNARSKSVKCIETGEVFESMILAANHLKVSPTSIQNVVKGVKQRVKGLTFTLNT